MKIVEKKIGKELEVTMTFRVPLPEDAPMSRGGKNKKLIGTGFQDTEIEGEIRTFSVYYGVPATASEQVEYQKTPEYKLAVEQKLENARRLLAKK